MKGLFFSLDAIVAFVIILFILGFSFSFFTRSLSTEKQNYSFFSTQAKLIQVSELMVTDSEKGLVKYENEEVKHHQLKQENFHLKKEVSIDGENYGVEVLALNQKGSFQGISISRLALCGDDLCVVKVTKL